MKLAILSDFHLGYDRFHEDAYKQAEEALNSAASVADVLLIPGDIFDNRAPKPEVLAEAINLFRNLSAKEWKARVESVEAADKAYTSVPIIAIPGTHERRSQGAENPVNLLSLAGLLVDVTDGFAVIKKGNERVAVYGLGGVSEERFLETIKNLNPKPIEGCFNVFMFHQSAHELLSFNNDFAHLSDLPKGFDLYIDGHFHNRVEKKVHGKPFLIPGSTVLTQLKSAEQDDKGFYVYDTSAGSYTFNKIKSRQLIIIKIDANEKDPEELSRIIKEKIGEVVKGQSEKPIVRVEINGRLKSGFKNIDVDVQGIAKSYHGRAIVEIAKSGIDGIESNLDIDALRKGSLENMSVKDYGLGIFIEKLRQNKYNLEVSPSEIFEMLSSESNKEKAIKKVLEALFSN